MPRFVLLRHTCSEDYREGPHWDLMLEREATEQEHRLATWSFPRLPAGWASLIDWQGETSPLPIAAAVLDDHRARYLDYEGPLSGERGSGERGSGDRGSVARWAEGGCEWRVDEEALCQIALLAPSPLAGLLELRLADDLWQVDWKPIG